MEPNNSPDKAQAVAVNSAVNGSSDGNNQDLFKLTLKQGQRIVIDCQSARLDTEMDPTLVLFAADGRQLASNADYYGRDPLIDFVAPADGEYLVEVKDLTYRGGYPYRLVITDRPHIENVFPRAVQAGQTVELTVLGRNLGPGSVPSSWKLGDLEFGGHGHIRMLKQKCAYSGGEKKAAPKVPLFVTDAPAFNSLSCAFRYFQVLVSLRRRPLRACSSRLAKEQ